MEYELLQQHTVGETNFHRANTCSLRQHRDTCILANSLELTEPPTSRTTNKCCQLLLTDTTRLTASLPVVPALLACGPKSPWVVCITCRYTSITVLQTRRGKYRGHYKAGVHHSSILRKTKEDKSVTCYEGVGITRGRTHEYFESGPQPSFSK